jgi:hypothetical protein
MGTIEGDKLSGTLTHGGSQSKIECRRSRKTPLAVGNWEMKFKVGEREITATLAVKTDKEGKLSAEWQSPVGEHKITDVQYEGGKLTFKRQSKIEDRQFESTFEGTIKKDTLSGIIKTEQGEMPAEGKLIGSAIIGIWNLDVDAPWGSSKQRLKVNPDMSGMFGINPVEKVTLDGDKVSFKIVPEFGRMRFEMNFEGKLDGSTLTGELKNPRGSQVVKGKKDTSVF